MKRYKIEEKEEEKEGEGDRRGGDKSGKTADNVKGGPRDIP
jgi:hypothetical protein